MTPGRRRLSLAALAATLPAAFALAAPGGAGAPPNDMTRPSASPRAAPLETLPVLVGRELPEAASPAPSAAEWTSARVVRPHRGAPGPCTYRSVREWLEIRCNALVGAGLVAGDPKGVVVRTTGQYEMGDPPLVVRAVVPIRRGEAKVLGFLEARSEYNGDSVAEAGTVSILWRAGRPDPVLVASGFIPQERPPERQ